VIYQQILIAIFLNWWYSLVMNKTIYKIIINKNTTLQKMKTLKFLEQAKEYFIDFEKVELYKNNQLIYKN